MSILNFDFGAGQSDCLAVDLIVTLAPGRERSTYGIFGTAGLVALAGFVRRRRAAKTGA